MHLALVDVENRTRFRPAVVFLHIVLVGHGLHRHTHYVYLDVPHLRVFKPKIFLSRDVFSFGNWERAHPFNIQLQTHHDILIWISKVTGMLRTDKIDTNLPIRHVSPKLFSLVILVLVEIRIIVCSLFST